MRFIKLLILKILAHRGKRFAKLKKRLTYVKRLVDIAFILRASIALKSSFPLANLVFILAK